MLAYGHGFGHSVAHGFASGLGWATAWRFIQAIPLPLLVVGAALVGLFFLLGRRKRAS